jgi:hypothetical protein
MILGRTSTRVLDSSLTIVQFIGKSQTENNIGNLQKIPQTLGEWTVENWMKLNPGKSKSIKFARARVKSPLSYSLGNQTIPEAGSCKYLGIIARRNLNWVDQVNYTTQKA